MSLLATTMGIAGAQRNGYQPTPDAAPAPGRTKLTPLEEERFNTWAKARGVNPEDPRDYRSLWKYNDPKAAAAKRRK